MSTSAGKEQTGPARRSDEVGIATRMGKRRRSAHRRLVVVAFSDGWAVVREFAFRRWLVVPSGVCRVRIEAAGASGGLQGAGRYPGPRRTATATLRVSPPRTLVVHVGGQGGAAVGATPGRGGWNGGGDGGAAIDGTPGANALDMLTAASGSPAVGGIGAAAA